MEKAGIYVHIPFCESRCAYCSFVSSTDLSSQNAYITSLKAEIAERGAVFSQAGTTADTLYIGGGTPSVLFPGNLKEIIDAVRKSFSIDQSAEITVECNPKSAGEEFFSECFKAGVNRVSLGLQSHDEKILKAVRRLHTAENFVKTIECAKAAGIDNISADVMIGLPGQDGESVENTLKFVTSFSQVKHISLYALKIEEGTPLFETGYVPDEDFQAEVYERCLSHLERIGFYRYEVSNFSKPGFESRHNLKYWTMKPYIGLGAAAHSFFGGERSFNTSNISEYTVGRREKGRHAVSESDFKEEYVMLALRTSKGIDLKEYRERFGEDIRDEKKIETYRLVSDGLIEIRNGRLYLTRGAFYVMNSVILKLL